MDHPMFDVLSDLTKSSDDHERFEILQDLERNTSDAVRSTRTSERVAIRCPIIVQSANSSELLNMKAKGVTGNVSAGGCQVLMPVPLQVGDVYRITFDPNVVNLPLVFARCLRCRLIAEDAFESGFAFFTEINLNEVIRADEAS